MAQSTPTSSYYPQPLHPHAPRQQQPHSEHEYEYEQEHSQPQHPVFDTYTPTDAPYSGYSAPAPAPPQTTTHDAIYPSTSAGDQYGAGFSAVPVPRVGAVSAAGTAVVRPKRRGRFRQFWAAYKTPNQIIFLSAIVLQAVVVLLMIALVYATINNGTGDISASQVAQDPRLESIATYLGLFILAMLFEILVSLDALQQKNIIQTFLLLPFQAAMIAYSSVLPTQLRSAISNTSAATPDVLDHVRAYAIVIPCVIGAVTLVLALVAWRLLGEFGWDVFKRIGADRNLKKYYFRYQVFVCLLKFDAFFFVGFSIQFLVLVSGTPTAEFVMTIAAVPIILVCLVLAALAVRFESRPGVYLFFLLDIVGMAYFIYKTVRIYSNSSSDRYATAKTTLTIFSVISFLMLLMTFIMTGLCLLNFDKGLKDNIPPYAWGANRLHRIDGGAGDGTARKSGSIVGGGAGEKGGRTGALERHETRMSLD